MQQRPQLLAIDPESGQVSLNETELIQRGSALLRAVSNPVTDQIFNQLEQSNDTATLQALAENAQALQTVKIFVESPNDFACACTKRVADKLNAETLDLLFSSPETSKAFLETALPLAAAIKLQEMARDSAQNAGLDLLTPLAQAHQDTLNIVTNAFEASCVIKQDNLAQPVPPLSPEALIKQSAKKTGYFLLGMFEIQVDNGTTIDLESMMNKCLSDGTALYGYMIGEMLDDVTVPQTLTDAFKTSSNIEPTKEDTNAVFAAAVDATTRQLSSLPQYADITETPENMRTFFETALPASIACLLLAGSKDETQEILESTYQNPAVAREIQASIAERFETVWDACHTPIIRRQDKTVLPQTALSIASAFFQPPSKATKNDRPTLQ